MDDNYVTLLPGETRALVAEHITPDVAADYEVHLQTWNNILGIPE